ncbi:hypothetical protein GCM10008171_32870 [Methylopila jiangsuensis]|uniref:Uncharacterized protein n=1 Tax=Methylopila jiangsuensis TaxID=586230 RepID=A0A9W6JKT5_9HYPH|nr:hypothetical protein [Methylopila jiangsuensis]MDR6284578.1 hypothetical protein [Methylopila jiangsuensis]GLK78033.1 hypothetical protein GCM10008171_32870 [Methylopila jiangsuensis]
MAVKKSDLPEGEAPADIAPATGFTPAGAPDQIVPDVDPSHPAVDDNPRAGTSINQNRIDFNDPNLTDEQAVEKNLNETAKS